MTDRAVYLAELAREPWSVENNCWHVVRRIRRDLFGCESLPAIGADLVERPELRQAAFSAHPSRADWRAVETPSDGDVAVMARAFDLHIGIYLEGSGRGLIWHSDRGHNLVGETALEVRLRRWQLRFYRKHDDPRATHDHRSGSPP